MSGPAGFLRDRVQNPLSERRVQLTKRGPQEQLRSDARRLGHERAVQVLIVLQVTESEEPEHHHTHDDDEAGGGQQRGVPVAVPAFELMAQPNGGDGEQQRQDNHQQIQRAALLDGLWVPDRRRLVEQGLRGVVGALIIEPPGQGSQLELSEPAALAAGK